MLKESHLALESSNKTRVSPYPLLSSRTNKYKTLESHIQSEMEDVRCVICMEPPHNAVLLTCSSSPNGCLPYMCDTSSHHSNCFKQFRKKNKTKRLNAKILKCPLCRGEVIKKTKVTSASRNFMNAKPKSCFVNDCKFSGTYSQLDKHLKNDHLGLIPQKAIQHELPYTYHIPLLRVNIVNGTVTTITRLRHVRNEFGATNSVISHMPRQ